MMHIMVEKELFQLDSIVRRLLLEHTVSRRRSETQLMIKTSSLQLDKIKDEQKSIVWKAVKLYVYYVHSARKQHSATCSIGHVAS